MTNIRTIVLLVIIFALALGGVYYIYKTQVNKNNDLLPYPSPGTGFGDLASPSPSPMPSPVSGQNPPRMQPESGSNTVSINNEGINVTGPQASSIITSPVVVSGSANVFEGKVVVLIRDASGKILGQGNTTACMGYDACPFEVTINFNKSTTYAGTIEVYNPSGVDGSPKYLQTLLVRF